MPNFFLLSGPFAPVNSIAIPGSLSDEVGFLMKLLEMIQVTGDAYAPSEAATEQFRAQISDALPNTTYSACSHSWYRDPTGVPIVWPFSRQEHADLFKHFSLQDFDRYPRERVGAREQMLP
jgi:hypothetical protein